MYTPGGRSMRNLPLAPEWASFDAEFVSTRRIRRLAASGRGAHCGWGGNRSTGQVGPASTRPLMPDWSGCAPAVPHAASETTTPASTPRLRMFELSTREAARPVVDVRPARQATRCAFRANQGALPCSLVSRHSEAGTEAIWE
jgi:hypothetical protein